jgi:alpha-beta hydrolase superfamily lysophospholipase
MSEAALDLAPPRTGDTVAAVLVLHGGRVTSTEPVRARHLAVVRMRPFADALSRAGERHGLAVARLRYAVRGWNGELRSPVGDVTDALERIGESYGDVPVAVVGHSMGGRAALHVAGRPAVTTIVGLAPWIEREDDVAPVRGRHVLLAHGTRDRTTSARRSAGFVRAAQGVAASAAFVAVHRDAHALLRRAGLWHDLTTGYVLARLCGIAPSRSVGPDAAAVLDQVLAGKTAVDV